MTGSLTGFTVSNAVITLSDDDTVSTSLTLSASIENIDEEAGEAVTVRVTATLDGAPRAQATTVTLDVDELSSAERDTDYTALGSLGDETVDITIGASQQSGFADVTITPLPDDIDEGDGETIIITGTATSNSTSIGVNTVTVTIDDDDTASTVIDLVSDVARIGEDATGSVPVTVTATLRGDKTHRDDITVALSLGGDATGGGEDYTATGLETSVTIPKGTSEVTTSFSITAEQDEESEGLEDIVVEGSATLANADTVFEVNPATIRLVDDDLPIIELTIERVSPEGPDDSVNEGESARFRVTASRTLDAVPELDAMAITVPLSLGGGAENGIDYRRLTPGSIRIPANRERIAHPDHLHHR